MRLVNLFLTGMILIAACSNATNGTSMTTHPGNSIKWTRLIAGNQCNIEAPLKLVIVNQEQFDSLWVKAFTMDMPPEKPAIDFTKNSVVALFSGMVNKGGQSIEVTSIQQDQEKGTVIEATHRFPGKNCFSTMAIEFPYYLALTDILMSGETTFTVKMKEVDCE